MKKILFAALIAVSVFVPVLAANTQEQAPIPKPASGFELRPDNPSQADPYSLVLELKPGTGTEELVNFTNFNRVQTHYYAYVADMYISKKDGHVDFFTSDNTSPGTVKNWIKLEKGEFDLAPEDTRPMIVKISVPSDAKYGNYLAGVMMEVREPAKNNPLITIASRYVLNVKIKVTDNPQPVLRLSDLQTNTLEIKPYFWIAAGIFVLCMAYFVYGSLKERKKKKMNQQL